LSNAGYRYDPAADSWTGTLSTLGAPTPRWGHTAVWTGAEMIVWGGSDATGVLNDGYRYDPRSDTWSGPISVVSAPAARRAHTAVWTGAEMVIWGGADATLPLDTGARYDPATDTWAPVATAGAPTVRWHHAAVWTGDEMIVWGGFDGVNPVDTGKRYVPSTDTWGSATSTTGTPPGKLTLSAVWTGQEMIVFGGQTTQGSGGTDTGGRYDPVADAWQPTATANAPAIRYGHSGVWTGSEMVVWGGAPSFQNTGKRYLPAVALPVGTHAGVFTVSDPRAANSPQHVTVTFQVTP
jgi:N-acetylneuraminic acid mutarotase